MLHFSNFTRLQGYKATHYKAILQALQWLQYNNITQVVNTSYKATQGYTTRL